MRSGLIDVTMSLNRTSRVRGFTYSWSRTAASADYAPSVIAAYFLVIDLVSSNGVAGADNHRDGFSLRCLSTASEGWEGLV